MLLIETFFSVRFHYLLHAKLHFTETSSVYAKKKVRSRSLRKKHIQTSKSVIRCLQLRAWQTPAFPLSQLCLYCRRMETLERPRTTVEIRSPKRAKTKMVPGVRRKMQKKVVSSATGSFQPNVASRCKVFAHNTLVALRVEAAASRSRMMYAVVSLRIKFRVFWRQLLLGLLKRLDSEVKPYPRAQNDHLHCMLRSALNCFRTNCE